LGNSIVARHVIHHRGDRRPDWGFPEFAVSLAGAFVAFFLIIAYLPAIIATLVGLGLTGTAAALTWHLTKLQRKRLELWWLRRRLDQVSDRFAAGRATAEMLSPKDQKLAQRRLEEVREAGRAVCGQLRDLKNELLGARECVMKKLGELPVDKLAPKLSPFTTLEEEIDKALRGFDVAIDDGNKEECSSS
jgi:hypothetical protein